MKEQLKRRLTRKVYDGEYEGSLYDFQQIINKLGKYEDMEDMKENTQSSLSLCVGDIVWSYCKDEDEILPYHIENITCFYAETSNAYIIYTATYNKMKYNIDFDKYENLYKTIDFTTNDINKTVFLNAEAATQFIKETNQK